MLKTLQLLSANACAAVIAVNAIGPRLSRNPSLPERTSDAAATRARGRWVVSMAAVLALGAASNAHAQGQRGDPPCTNATAACTEWISLTTEPQRVLVYRTYPLDARNQSISRALILVHGGGRNAGDSFNTALAAAFLAGALENTVLIAPRFSSTVSACKDTLASGEANWGCEDQRPDSWRNGSTAVGNEKLTSFDFIDEILRKLARKETFPNLRGVVIAGHSGGGQFTLRYAMSNESHDKVGVPIAYVVSNPDALVYFDGLRPTAASYPVAAAAPGYVLTPPADLFVPFADARNCGTYENWPYALQHRTGYTARLTDEQLKRQLSARPVVYLLGGLDIFPISGFDSSCPAMAQGPTRLARSIAFNRYVNDRFGAQHKTAVVPTCGHNDRCMFTANATLSLLFPK